MSILLVLSLAFLLTGLTQTTLPANSSLIVYDRNQRELYRHTETSTNGKVTDTPYSLKASTLIAEDRHFFQHNGIDPAAWIRLLAERIGILEGETGGSTIAQQTARAILGINRPRSVFNKLEDIVLSQLLENTSDKSSLLNYYLNSIDYGNATHGITAASQYYWDSLPETLSWQQATLLAALIKNPTQLNPYRNLPGVLKRQTYISDSLLKHNIISTEEHQLLKATPLQLAAEGKKIKAPHFVYFAISELEKVYGKQFWNNHQVQVITTLDVDFYDNNREITQEELQKLSDKEANNSASIIVDNKSGEVLSYLGNRNFFDTSHAGAVDMVQALRQPGSALKPFIYLTAILNGWGTGTVIYDIPSRFLTASDTPYTPLNYDLKFHGPVTLRSALANSYNVPAVKALEYAGLNQAKSLLKRFGINSLTNDNDHYGLSLALGSGEVSLWELSNAYRTLANRGEFSDLKFIKALQIDGKEYSLSNNIPVPAQAPVPAAISMLTDVLSDQAAREPQFHEHNDISFPFPVAAKTGTSRDFNDNWVLGYTPRYTVGVWVGNTDGTPMKQVSGIAGAGPIFHRLMSSLGPQGSFALAKDVEKAIICLPSGLLPTTLCPHTVEEFFLPNTEPTRTDTWYQNDGLHVPSELSSWQQEFATTSTLMAGLRILAPQNHDIFQLDPETPLENQSIPCRIQAPEMHTIRIHLNGKILNSCNLPLESGKYTLTVSAMDKNDQKHEKSVSYQVQN